MSMSKNAPPEAELPQKFSIADSVRRMQSKRIIVDHVILKSLEELKDFTSVVAQIEGLKSEGITPPVDFLAKSVHQVIADLRLEEGNIQPEGSELLLRLTDHKMLIFIEKIMDIEPELYGTLAARIVQYCVQVVFPNPKHNLGTTDTVCKLGKFYGALCRKFLPAQMEKDLLFTAIYCRPLLATTFAFGVLCSFNDVFSMLPDVFDYSKVTPCEKLMLFALQNPMGRVAHSVELRSLFVRGLRHPSFECTWDQMILKTLDEMAGGMESEEQILSAVKGIALLLVQGGWANLGPFVRKHLHGLVEKWTASKYSNVVLAGFLAAIGKAAAQSEDKWDIEYLRSEVTNIHKMRQKLKLMDDMLRQAFADCLGNLDRKDEKISRPSPRGPPAKNL